MIASPVSPRTMFDEFNSKVCKAAVFVSNTPRYNAKVVEVVDKETYRLQYTDYGNEEVVNIKRIVTSLETLVVQMVDVGVNLQLQLCC